MSESVQVAVGVVDGKVVARWHAPVTEIAFDTRNAYSVGMALATAAMEAHRGTAAASDVSFVTGELEKPKVSDAQRDLVIGIVATQLKTLIEAGRSPGYIAMHCVDAVLQEVAR